MGMESFVTAMVANTMALGKKILDTGKGKSKKLMAIKWIVSLKMIKEVGK